MIAGLLEGAAFLAARVQLKLKHEFPEFTGNLLEQLVPNYLAPTPSAMLAKVLPPYSDPALRDGRRSRAAPISTPPTASATADRLPLSACAATSRSGRSTSPAPSTSPTAGPLQALGSPVGARRARRPAALADPSHRGRAHRGRNCRTPRREASRRPGSPAAARPNCRSICSARRRTRSRSTSSSSRDCIGVYFRYLDDFGDPVIIPAPRDCLRQIGFDEDDALFPNDNRIFRGFDFLREYFMFPRKFLGFKLTGLAAVMPRLRRQSRSTSCSPSTR